MVDTSKSARASGQGLKAIVVSEAITVEEKGGEGPGAGTSTVANSGANQWPRSSRGAAGTDGEYTKTQRLLLPTAQWVYITQTYKQHTCKNTHTRIVTPANKYTYILTSMHTHAHVYILHVHTCMLNIHCHTVQSQCSQLQWWHSTSPTLASILDHMIMARNGTGACVHSSTPIPPFHPSMTPAPTPIH